MRKVNLLKRYPSGAGNRPIDERVEAIRRGENLREVAKTFEREYFDGTRLHGYGGYYYDGRWKPVAQDIIEHYALRPGDRVLDIGCAKGFFLYDIMQLLPGIKASGCDISKYALDHSMDSVRPFLTRGNASTLPYESGSFDLVISINVVHSMKELDCRRAVAEMERVSRKDRYLQVITFRDAHEKENLEKWALTEEMFLSPGEWEQLFQEVGYSGDYYWTIVD